MKLVITGESRVYLQSRHGLGVIASNTFGKVLSPVLGAYLGTLLWFAPLKELKKKIEARSLLYIAAVGAERDCYPYSLLLQARERQEGRTIRSKASP